MKSKIINTYFDASVIESKRVDLSRSLGAGLKVVYKLQFSPSAIVLFTDVMNVWHINKYAQAINREQLVPKLAAACLTTPECLLSTPNVIIGCHLSLIIRESLTEAGSILSVDDWKKKP